MLHSIYTQNTGGIPATSSLKHAALLAQSSPFVLQLLWAIGEPIFAKCFYFFRFFKFTSEVTVTNVCAENERADSNVDADDSDGEEDFKRHLRRHENAEAMEVDAPVQVTATTTQSKAGRKDALANVNSMFHKHFIVI